MEADLDRRFGGVGRAYGTQALARFRAARVAVVGIGGVGTWAAEALARTAIGGITLIDLDHIAESNTNRQIHALDENFGKAKASAMGERIRAINPSCVVEEVDDFVTPENAATLLTAGFDVVVDAIDQVRAKVAMIAVCHAAGVPIVVAGGAGGRTNPGQVRCDDLARTEQDPLLARVRATLRKAHGFARDPRRKFGVPAVYSLEPVLRPQGAGACEAGAPTGGLGCAGYGSAVCVTATFGFFAAAAALAILEEREHG